MPGIEYKTGTRVTRVNVASKNLETGVGETVQYDKLIIATGARPVLLSDFNVPGADLEGIYYLRNVIDADKLVHAMADAKLAGNKVSAESMKALTQWRCDGTCRQLWSAVVILDWNAQLDWLAMDLK